MFGLGKIAEFFVQFSAQGLAGVSSAYAQVAAGATKLGAQISATAAPVAAVGAAAAAAGKQLGGMLLGMQPFLMQSAGAAASALGQILEGLGQVSGALGRLILPLSASLQGFVISGVMASSAGQVLSIQFQELSRQIASLFAPQVRWLIDKMGELLRWFQALTGAQQAGLRTLGLLVMGLGALAIAIPIVIVGFKLLIAVIAGVKAMVLGLTAVMAINPIFLIGMGIAAVFVAVGAAVAALTVATLGWKGTLDLIVQVGKNLAGTFSDIADAIKAQVVALKETYQLLSTMGGLVKEHPLYSLAQKAKEMSGSSEKESMYEWAERSRRNLVRQAMNLVTMGRYKYEHLEEGYDKKARPREELSPRLTGFEDISATYKRIAEAARLVGTGAQEATPVEAIRDMLIRVEESGGIKIANWPRPPLAR